jgi:hypothetical protein
MLMTMLKTGRRAVAAAVLLCGALAPAALASPFDPSGVVRLVKPAHAQLNANRSTNWFGYNQGTLEQGGKLFTSVTSDWTVPTASSHKAGEAESSATWIGIGWGCVDAGCTLNDASLIQTGTEQDVDSSGHASYSAWWELVPVPAVTISNMTVSPGDHIHASVTESVLGSSVWTITLKDVTRNESFSTTVPYTSTNSTAEWIDETPLTIDSSGASQASLPNLTLTPFDNATANGSSAHLTASEELQLVDGSGAVIGTPSGPDPEADGFADCAWATHCAIPSTSPAATHPPTKRGHPPSKRSRPHGKRKPPHHRSKRSHRKRRR